MIKAPVICANLRKIKENAACILGACRQQGVTLAAVTKVVCAHEPIVNALIESGVPMLADARTKNLARLPEGLPRLALRLTDPELADETAEHAQYSLESGIDAIRALGRALDLSFSRVQFTPDLMPADITGTEIMEERDDGRRGFRFQRGPVFANLVLADEINRATPKTQSALLEAMQERTVTVANTTYPLPAPFFVLATQNPIEQEGTYPLPEAQLDRFLFKVNVPFPSADELSEILARTTARPSRSYHPSPMVQRSSPCSAWRGRSPCQRPWPITSAASLSPPTPAVAPSVWSTRPFATEPARAAARRWC